jgi:arginine decarboxylase
VRTAAKKTINKVKDSMVERQGPVKKDQSRVPYEDAINAYWERDLVTFAIPAHNGGRGPAPEFTRWMGAQVARADLPTTHGLDTRNSAYGVQTTAQELFADAVGAKHTFFSTCGSSMSVRVAIMAVAGPGETIVMARNGHKSAFAGLILSGAKPVYVDPWYDEELEIAHAVLPEDLEAGLDANPDAKAALVFSPSYYGTATDIKSLADICHQRGVPLLTDDAWGLDYGLGGHPELPEGSLAQGADIAIGSGHKTTTALTQTSVLSVGSDRIDMERLTLCFEVEQSTSVSALLASSIDGARCQFLREGEQLLGRAVSTAKLLRTRIESEVPEISIVDTELLRGRPGVKGVDPTHVLIEVAPLGITGYQALDWMRAEHDVDVELVDHRRLMPLVTYAHGAAEVDAWSPPLERWPRSTLVGGVTACRSCRRRRRSAPRAR